MPRIWRIVWRIAALAVLLGAMRHAAGMVLERVGEDLFATGPVVAADAAAFQREFDRGGVRRVILVNSVGGSLAAGLRVAEMIERAGADTLVSGYCHSACSLMFIAGRDRRFATGAKPRNTMVGIHGPSRRDTREPVPQAAQRMLALYRSRMGERFQPAIVEQALFGIADHTGMLRMREIERTRPEERVPWFCPSRDTPREQCVRHSGHDAFTLGVVTSAQTVFLELPATMQPVLEHFGLSLERAPEISMERVREWSSAACKASTRCTDSVEQAWQRWAAGDLHRAIAVGVDRAGITFRHGDDSPQAAAQGALAACNATPPNARLCRLAALDDRELPDLVRSAREQAPQMLAALPAPEPRALQAERNEPVGPSFVGFRTDNRTLPTPAQIEGVQTLDTEALVQALRSSPDALIIDVAAGGREMLPGALHLIDGGRAFADASLEARLDERFRAVLRAAGASPERRIIFYCSGSSSWASLNAALRASRGVPGRIAWYRGGLAAWKRAGLPVLQKTAVAAL